MGNRREPQLRDLDDWWQPANYLTVGQIYLLANPMLQQALRPEHIKPRLLGHWGNLTRSEPCLRAPQSNHPRP